MAEVSGSTLVVAIQAVQLAIKYTEKMLEAEVLGDREDLEEYLLTLRKGQERLRYAYMDEKKRDPSLPEYDALLKIRLL